jgi:hypothetical protein
MIGNAMVTMATEVFCLNKLLEKFALLPYCVLWVVLRVKRFIFDNRRY